MYAVSYATHADGSLFVCPHDETKKAESTITKLGTGIVHRESTPRPHQLILHQKVKVTAESQSEKKRSA